MPVTKVTGKHVAKSTSSNQMKIKKSKPLLLNAINAYKIMLQNFLYKFCSILYIWYLVWCNLWLVFDNNTTYSMCRNILGWLSELLLVCYWLHVVSMQTLLMMLTDKMMHLYFYILKAPLLWAHIYLMIFTIPLKIE